MGKPKHTKSCTHAKCWVPKPTVITVLGTPPVFTKFFAPEQVAVRDTFTLTFVIDNTANTVDATNVSFTDTLPAGMTAASVQSTGCSGTVDISNPGIISFSGGTVPAGEMCEIVVNMSGMSAAGSYNNTTSSLTSSLGTSAPATATLFVLNTPRLQRKKT